jgi:hypothetical protein
MFRGKAELRNPETNARVGTFTETCEEDGFSHARVVLEPPITLSGTENLTVFGGPGGVIGVAAENGGPTVVHEFHGKSGVGCLPDGAEGFCRKFFSGLRVQFSLWSCLPSQRVELLRRTQFDCRP